MMVNSWLGRRTGKPKLAAFELLILKFSSKNATFVGSTRLTNDHDTFRRVRYLLIKAIHPQN
ncbi:hypothetical protein OLMES_1375 [Oleiphilus messinensis]|uniref:Uncharacterized protein n=1 Tax=Oleiphilus messinensis TaxID=141451 RepID=A0A1Y0I4Q0_9GAMM|nr:hypothetical protein OLMES_1375 [Oleiphilus messinensis]